MQHSTTFYQQLKAVIQKTSNNGLSQDCLWSAFEISHVNLKLRFGRTFPVTYITWPLMYWAYGVSLLVDPTIVKEDALRSSVFWWCNGVSKWKSRRLLCTDTPHVVQWKNTPMRGRPSASNFKFVWWRISATWSSLALVVRRLQIKQCVCSNCMTWFVIVGSNTVPM